VTLRSLSKALEVFRHVLCGCPCGHVFRMSEGKLVDTRRKDPDDWLGRLRSGRGRLERQCERAHAAYDLIQEGIAIRERRNAERLVARSVRAVMPSFQRLRINTHDVKALFSPVRFIAFDGLRFRNVKRVRLLDVPARSHQQEQVQTSIERSIRNGHVSWATLRVDDGGRVVRE